MNEYLLVIVYTVGLKKLHLNLMNTRFTQMQITYYRLGWVSELSPPPLLRFEPPAIV